MCACARHRRPPPRASSVLVRCADVPPSRVPVASDVRMPAHLIRSSVTGKVSEAHAAREAAAARTASTAADPTLVYWDAYWIECNDRALVGWRSSERLRRDEEGWEAVRVEPLGRDRDGRALEAGPGACISVRGVKRPLSLITRKEELELESEGRSVRDRRRGAPCPCDARGGGGARAGVR